MRFVKILAAAQTFVISIVSSALAATALTNGELIYWAWYFLAIFAATLWVIIVANIIKRT